MTDIYSDFLQNQNINDSLKVPIFYNIPPPPMYLTT